MLHAKYEDNQTSGSGDLKVFFTIYGRGKVSCTIYNKKNYNMSHHIIIGGFIDVYIVVRFVWF